MKEEKKSDKDQANTSFKKDVKESQIPRNNQNGKLKEDGSLLSVLGILENEIEMTLAHDEHLKYCFKYIRDNCQKTDDLYLNSPSSIACQNDESFECPPHSKSDSEPGTLSASSRSPSPKKKLKKEVWPNKLKVLYDLKKAVISEMGCSFEPQEISMNWLLESIEKIGIKRYNKILSNLLHEYSPSSKVTASVLKNWRARMKRCISLFIKPKHWREWLKANDKFVIFKQKIVEILRNMSTRNAEELREKILQTLKEFPKDPTAHGQMRELTHAACSKRWWGNFMRKNPYINDLWKKLPRQSFSTKIESS